MPRLIVDDTPENIDILNGILGAKYKIKVALNGKTAPELAACIRNQCETGQA